MTAADSSTSPNASGNVSPDVVREFVVASSYVPKTVDELVSRRSYLADLIRFANSHLLDANNNGISTQLLTQSFMPNVNPSGGDVFGIAADPGSRAGELAVNELLPAVSLLQITNQRP